MGFIYKQTYIYSKHKKKGFVGGFLIILKPCTKLVWSTQHACFLFFPQMPQFDSKGMKHASYPFIFAHALSKLVLEKKKTTSFDRLFFNGLSQGQTLEWESDKAFVFPQLKKKKNSQAEYL